MTDFHKIWYERYATSGSYILIYCS